jgi:hypothetical protein
MRITLLLLTALLTVVSANGAPQVSSPAGSCKAAPMRALDFWIGRWNVLNAKGQRAASSVIDLVADGCGVLERYSGAPAPDGTQYIGAGLHVFDRAENGWRQLWSDNRPGVTVMDGRQTDAGIVYEWAVTDPQGKRVLKRYTLSNVGSGSARSVRQLGERSDDGGKTWTIEFDLRYVPA